LVQTGARILREHVGADRHALQVRCNQHLSI
jgi:hypothetical protein